MKCRDKKEDIHFHNVLDIYTPFQGTWNIPSTCFIRNYWNMKKFQRESKFEIMISVLKMEEVFQQKLSKYSKLQQHNLCTYPNSSFKLVPDKSKIYFQFHQATNSAPHTLFWTLHCRVDQARYRGYSSRTFKFLRFNFRLLLTNSIATKEHAKTKRQLWLYQESIMKKSEGHTQ